MTDYLLWFHHFTLVVEVENDNFQSNENLVPGYSSRAPMKVVKELFNFLQENLDQPNFWDISKDISKFQEIQSEFKEN
jgi:hypothetical protein